MGLLYRRDFLKLAATTAILTACGRGLEPPPGELKRKSFDYKTVIYNGKTISVKDLDELGIEASGFYYSVESILNRKISGESSAAIRPQGYKGADFPTGWVLDPSQTTIIINKSDKDDFTAHAFIGRKTDGSIPFVGDGAIGQLVNDGLSASAYKDHSLLVVGRNNQALWFDNVESKTPDGTARIVVDGGKGKVFQISTNKPNFIEEMFQGQEVEMNIGEIDVNAGETNFTDILTPMSEGFMGFLDGYIKLLPPTMTTPEKIENIKYFFAGIGLDTSAKNELEKMLARDGKFYAQALNRFNATFPFNASELAFVNSVLAENIKSRINDGVWGELKSKIVGIIPTADDINRDAVNQIVSERISLPVATPEVYFLKVKDENEKSKWVVATRRTVWENDGDGTKLTPYEDAFSVRDIWYTHGEVSQEIVEDNELRNFEKIVDGFPFEGVKDMESNQNTPLMGLNLAEVRQVDSEAIRFVFDPSTNKIEPGIIVNVDGEGRFIKLMLDNPGWKSDIKDLPIISNRKLPLMNFPLMLNDVTPEAIALIQRGQESCSPFLLGNHDDYWLTANAPGPDGFLDYDFMKGYLTPDAMASLRPLGTFVLGGSDNSMLINANTPDGQVTNINVYDSLGAWVRDIPVSHPIIVVPLEIDEYVGEGNGYFATIAIDKVTGEKYVVPGKSVFQIGAKSSATLAAIAVGEFAAAIATIYGGYRLIGKVGLGGKNFMAGIIEFLAKLSL